MIILPDIDPRIFTLSVFGTELAVHWYAMSYIVGFMLVIAGSKFITMRSDLWYGRNTNITANIMEDFIFFACISALIGGRIGYVLLYSLTYYIHYPLEIFMIWRGGMSFHGGFAGCVIACIILKLRLKIKFLDMTDIAALLTPPSLFLGRIANFINQELWGHPSTLPWSVVFPIDPLQIPRHPSQLYESILEGLLHTVILWGIVIYGKGLKYPGLLSGVFCLWYGISRITIEFFREPDQHIGFAATILEIPISRGQIFSIPLIIVGSILIARALELRKVIN